MLSLTPHAIKLVSYCEDGEDTRHFSFRLLEPHSTMIPEAGQFFMLHVPGAGAAPFTFTTPPDENGYFSALIKRMGSVTKALFRCKTGTILGARGPFGKGWPIKEMSGQRILIVAGGCGLAPLVGLTQTLLDNREYQSLTLLYGAASKSTQLLNPERERWRKKIAVYDVVEHRSSEKEEQVELIGTPVDVLDIVLTKSDKFPTALLLCGPEIMMRKVALEFINRGLPATSIWLSLERRMHCAVGLCGHCYLHHNYACKDGPTYRWDQLQSILPILSETQGSDSLCY